MVKRNKKPKKEKKRTKKQLEKDRREGEKWLDKVWSGAIKERDENKCVVCGKSEYLNSHHIIPKQIKELRWNPFNGITLCRLHHKWSNEISPHKNPFVFFNFMWKERKEQMQRLEEHYEQYKNNNL